MAKESKVILKTRCELSDGVNFVRYSKIVEEPRSLCFIVKAHTILLNKKLGFTSNDFNILLRAIENAINGHINGRLFNLSRCDKNFGSFITEKKVRDAVDKVIMTRYLAAKKIESQPFTQKSFKKRINCQIQECKTKLKEYKEELKRLETCKKRGYQPL